MSNTNGNNKLVNINSTNDTKEIKKEKSMPNTVGPAVSINNEKPIKQRQNIERYKKPNYYKFDLVKDDLVKQLDGSRTAKEVSKNLKISIQTLYKYVSLAHTQAAPGQKLMLKEEKIYNNKNSSNG